MRSSPKIVNLIGSVVIAIISLGQKESTSLYLSDVMNKEKGKMETKISNLTTKLNQMSATLEEEQQLNRSLTQNQVR